MEPKEASRISTTAAAKIMEAMNDAMNTLQAERELSQLAQGLAALTRRMEPKEAARVRLAAAGILTRAMNQDFREFGAAGFSYIPEGQKLLAQGLSAVFDDGRDLAAGGLSDQELVELLKEPLCVGAVRRAVIDQLGHHHKRIFADQWDSLRFTEEGHLGLDFSRPQ